MVGKTFKIQFLVVGQVIRSKPVSNVTEWIIRPLGKNDLISLALASAGSAAAL